MAIWEPCNYVSNLAYDRLVVEICKQEDWTLDIALAASDSSYELSLSKHATHVQMAYDVIKAILKHFQEIFSDAVTNRVSHNSRFFSIKRQFDIILTFLTSSTKIMTSFGEKYSREILLDSVEIKIMALCYKTMANLTKFHCANII